MSNYEKVELTDNDVMLIYRWFQSAMYKAGRNIRMPEGTDPSKTYQYRWIKKFADRTVNEWHLDMRTTKLLVESLVAYGKRNKLLNQGAGLLNSNMAVDLCVQTLETSINKSSTILLSLISSKMYLERSKLMSIEQLASSRRVGGYSNIFCAYDSGMLSLEYIALSRVCSNALNLINEVERSNFPSNRALFGIRARLLLDKEINGQIVDSMGKDLQSVDLLEMAK